MPSALAVHRARHDQDVVSRAGLPFDEFIDESGSALQSLVPSAGACYATFDPATGILAASLKRGALAGRNDDDLHWARLEYSSGADPTRFANMIRAGVTAVGTSRVTGGAPSRSNRMEELILPVFDFHDEARMVFADQHGVWGALALFRGSGDVPFSEEEVELLTLIAPAYARAARTAMLAHRPTSRTEPIGPAVVIVDSADRMVQTSPAAQAHLSRMGDGDASGDPLTSVYALVHALRHAPDAESVRVRIRRPDGIWLVLRAAGLTSTGERDGDIAITIEIARPGEVADLVSAAFGLSPREVAVTEQVLRGADTRSIAAALHLSPYTVQDYLKSIFDKTRVASRRELVARVYAGNDVVAS